MAIFTISDLHLSLNTDKPMDVFKGWQGYVEKLRQNWSELVTEDDTVVIPGDISWELKLENTVRDFEFINSLPGKKLIIKGNHDLWWSTKRKVNDFFEANGFDSISIIFNDAIVAEGRAVCGSRGWFYDSTEQDTKVVLREAGRLETSILAAEKTGFKPLLFMHYPPVYGGQVCEELFSVIKKHGIKTVYHGHIHGSGKYNACDEYEGVKFKLVSCDCINFTPMLIKSEN